MKAAMNSAMSDCVFCRIAKGEIPARFVHQDDEVVAFHDLSPQAPVHVLLIPRRHLTSLADCGAAEALAQMSDQELDAELARLVG